MSMELFYSPLACSLASHITLREAGLTADLTAVGLADKKTASGADYFAVTPKGQVPALKLDDGTILTEGPAVMQYLADRSPETGLLPPIGTPERYAVLSWLTYVNTEIHKQCLWPRFNPGPPPETKRWVKELLETKLAYVAAEIGDRPFLVGDRFTIADAYLTWALHLVSVVGGTLPAPLARYLEAMRARPAVRTAIETEGMPAPR
jgi:glutathione S-transferase